MNETLVAEGLAEWLMELRACQAAAVEHTRQVLTESSGHGSHVPKGVQIRLDPLLEICACTTCRSTAHINLFRRVKQDIRADAESSHHNRAKDLILHVP